MTCEGEGDFGRLHVMSQYDLLAGLSPAVDQASKRLEGGDGCAKTGFGHAATAVPSRPPDEAASISHHSSGGPAVVVPESADNAIAGKGKPASHAVGKTARKLSRSNSKVVSAFSGPGSTEAAAQKTCIADISSHVPRYLNVRNVAARYDMSVASVWRMAQSGRLPKPIKLTNGMTRWSIAELDAHDLAFGHLK
jgi:prophage regulatory protein